MSNEKLAEEGLLFYGVVGSHSYGMNTPTSDKDFKGVFYLPMKNIISPFRDHPQQVEGFRGEKDSVVYELNKYIKLLVDQNPNILELLWLDEKFIVYQHVAFEALRYVRKNLLSAKCKHTFSGYAYAQLKRIKGHNKWIENPQPKRRPKEIDYLSVVWNNTTNKEFNKVVPLTGYEVYGIGNSMYGMVEAYDSEVKIHDRHEDLIAHPQQGLFGSGDIKFNLIIKLNKEAYKHAVDDWQHYWDWKKNRNETRSVLEEAHGYDTKHAAHLIRLLRMGNEILRGEGVKVLRPDATELLAIRGGKYTYEQLLEQVDVEMSAMEELYKAPAVPDSINMEYVDKTLLDMYGMLWHMDSRREWYYPNGK